MQRRVAVDGQPGVEPVEPSVQRLEYSTSPGLDVQKSRRVGGGTAL